MTACVLYRRTCFMWIRRPSIYLAIYKITNLGLMINTIMEMIKYLVRYRPSCHQLHAEFTQVIILCLLSVFANKKHDRFISFPHLIYTRTRGRYLFEQFFVLAVCHYNNAYNNADWHSYMQHIRGYLFVYELQLNDDVDVD